MFGGAKFLPALVRRIRGGCVVLIAAILVTAVFAGEREELAKGKAALDAKDFDRAREVFNGVLQANSTCVPAYVGRGRAFRGKEDFEHALSDYTEALRLDPKSKDALWYRYHLYFYRDKYTEALADIDALIAIEPNEALNHRVRARNKMWLKDYAGALTDAELAIRLDPKDAANLNARAEILAKAKSYREAIEDYSSLLREDGKNADYFYERACLYNKIGAFSEAVMDFEEAISFKSDEGLYLNDYAWMLAVCSEARFREGARAVTLATKACELSGWKNSSRLDTLAAACACAGDFESAVRWQSEAVKLSKDREDSQKYSDRLTLFEQKKAYILEPREKDKIDWSLMRSDCFETVWRTVNDNYFDTTFGGVDWKAMREKYRLRLWATDDRRALGWLLQEMLDELHRTHFAIIPREMAVLKPEERGRIGYTGAEAAVIEKAVTIVKVKPDSPAAKAGIKPGDVVRRVGDHALSEIEDSMLPSVSSARKRLQYLRGYVEWWLSAPVGKEIVLLLQNTDGAEREAKIISVAYEGVWSEAIGFSPAQPVEFEFTRDATGNAYFSFNTFALPAMNEFKRCVRTLKEGDGLIIDLRANPGGLTLMAPGIFGRLSASETSLGTMHQRYGTEEFRTYPQSGAFLGPVAVLVDSASASTSEILAAGLQEAGRARVFGETTAGAALPSLFRTLPTGDMLQYAVADIKTPRGRLIEGNGVVPDEEIVMRRIDAVQGRDPVREAAQRWLAAQRGIGPQNLAGK